MAIIFALIAFLGWGTGDVFGGIVARKIGGYSSAFWSYIISIIVASLYIPFAIGDLRGLTLSTVLWLIVLIPIGAVPLIALYEGMRVGSASLVGTIGAAFGSLVVIFSIIFLGDKISFYQVLSIVVIFVGLFLSSLDLKTLGAKQLISDKGVPYALTSMVLWGIYFTFIKIPIKQIGWFWPAYLSWWGFPLVYIFMKARKIDLKFPKERKIVAASVVNALILGAALFAYNFASARGQTAIVAPIASSYPVLFAVLAYFVFKDRLKKQQIIGIGITLLGIVLLSIISSV